MVNLMLMFLVGNSIRSDEEKKEDKVAKTTAVESSTSSISAVKLFDEFLNQLVVTYFKYLTFHKLVVSL